MSRYQTMAGVAEKPFRECPSCSPPCGMTVDNNGLLVYSTELRTPLQWADYLAAQAEAFDYRRDVCTCGGQKYGGGTCSSWCDSSAARAQHAGGAS